MKKLLFLFTALAIGLTSFAQISSKVGSGDWSNTDTWVGDIIPGNTDNVIIVTNSIVTVDKDAAAKDITVNGELIISSGAALYTVPLAIGDFYQGGVVFYLDGSGGGLVCAVSDLSPGTHWGCHGTPIPGADGTAIGTGAQNTIDIVAGCQETQRAAKICAESKENGYEDWFLPSRDELNAMYQNKAAINATALANGGAAFVEGPLAYYWSSSEVSPNQARAQNFEGAGAYSNKDLSWRVRAVRAF